MHVLGIFVFLFLCNLNYNVPFYHLSHLSKVAKFSNKIAKLVTLKKKLYPLVLRKSDDSSQPINFIEYNQQNTVLLGTILN